MRSWPRRATRGSPSACVATWRGRGRSSPARRSSG
jgi:hypothetical protein